MAQEVIFAEQTLEGFESVADGLYLGVASSPAIFTVGEAYKVEWDGAEYTCVAFDADGIVVLGDATILGLSDDATGEPFLVAGGEAVSFYTADTATSHTVAIYQVVGDESEAYNANDAVILSYSQNPDLYENIPKVWLTHPTSTEDEPVLVPFTYGEAVSKEIEPDFSGGDMVVPIEEGELVTEMTVNKPDTLLPKNIRIGIEVAGVTGEFLGDTEEATVELAMADGDQIVLSSAEGKVLSKVTIQKPETLVPENIAEGVTIGGVVGTFRGGDVATVTFVNYDGSILYKRQVIIGDDCPDPIEAGKIETPTKEENGVAYTYDGWSLSDGGAVDEAALKNVTEDRTVYAIFSGGTFESTSWATIAARSADGTAQQHFNIGDTKTIELSNDDGTTTIVTVAIAGFNLHRNTNGVKDGITFILSGKSTVNGIVSDGLDTELYDKLPDDLKAVIKQSKIDTCEYNFDSYVVETKTGLYYLFAPEVTNYSNSLVNKNGGTLPMNGSNTFTQVTNTYDAGIFPLFDGMTVAELAEFLGITTGVSDMTRSLAYRNASGASYNYNVRIMGHATYTIAKYASNDGGGYPVHFCFRV